MSQVEAQKRPSVFGGAMIIAGTAVGAGMFSIPIVTSGVWFSGSTLMLVYLLVLYVSFRSDAAGGQSQL